MCMDKPMQPAAQQPLGFWTSRAGEAIRARTRGRLSDLGMTQPEWWALHQLPLHPTGVAVDAMVATIGPNESDGAIVDAVDSAVGKGWIDRQTDRLHFTPAGREQFEAAAQVQRELNDERRQGISNDDYETTIRVLQRTIDNVGGHAWHW